MTSARMTTMPSLNPEPEYPGQVFNLCVAVGQGGEYRDYVRLIDCVVDIAEPIDVKVHVYRDNGAFKEVAVEDNTTGLCLSIVGDGWGALMGMVTCNNKDKRQSFRLTGQGELVADASFAQEYCVTAGWPLFNAVGFQDPDGQTVVVAMNEAPVASAIRIRDDAGAVIDIDIPARAIQTVVY